MNLTLKSIRQVDNHHFEIQWSDGPTTLHRLSQLQRVCPCAGCVDETSGQRLVTEKDIDENVRALSIQNVGRYALKIRFTSGCSTGIYSYKMLRG